MGLDYSDFDVQAAEPADNERQDALLDALLTDRETIAAAETRYIAAQVELDRFMRAVLPNLSPEQMKQLAAKIPLDALGIDTGDAQAYDANFSVADELTLQIQAVQALRQHVFPGGRLKHDASVKEAKEVLTTCNQMIKTLMDSHERVMNMERFRAVESATLDILGELSDDLKNQFLDRLELKLAEVK